MAGESELLTPMVIVAPAYKQVLTPRELFHVAMHMKFPELEWPILDRRSVFTPERGPQLSRTSVHAVRVIDQKSIPPGRTFLTELLSSVQLGGIRDAAYSVRSRRSDTERQRVFRDGVLVNDPFDQVVHWNELPDVALARIELVPQGGGTAWGQSPSGVIQLFTMPASGKVILKPGAAASADPAYPQPPREMVTGTGFLNARIGEFGTRSLEFIYSEPTSVGVVQVLGRVFTTNGVSAISSDDRGAVDAPSWERNRWLETRLRRLVGEDLELVATVRGSETSRGLETFYQREHAKHQFASLQLGGRMANIFSWRGVLFAEHRTSSRTFSALDRARATETPVLDQYTEPVTTAGGSLTGTWPHWGDAHTNIGADFQITRGETGTRLGPSSGVFDREIISRAERTNTGVFIIHNRRLADKLRGMLGVRVDAFAEIDRQSREIDRTAGLLRREHQFSDKNGLEFSPSAGLVWEPRPGWRVRAVGQQSFRQPSLAEQYRLYGERNQFIEPNPRLKIEHSTSAEVTAEYTHRDIVSLVVRGFVTKLRDAPGTRPIANRTGNLSASFELPSSVEHRSRFNLERVWLQGAEVSVIFRREKRFSTDAGLRLQKAIIGIALESPSANGLDLPRMPRWVAVAGVTWRVTPKSSLRVGLRSNGREFVDEENTRRLSGALVADLALSHQLTDRAELFLLGENIGDTRVETGRGINDVSYEGAQRMFSTGVRVTW